MYLPHDMILDGFFSLPVIILIKSKFLLKHRIIHALLDDGRLYPILCNWCLDTWSLWHNVTSWNCIPKIIQIAWPDVGFRLWLFSNFLLIQMHVVKHVFVVSLIKSVTNKYISERSSLMEKTNIVFGQEHVVKM